MIGKNNFEHFCGLTLLGLGICMPMEMADSTDRADAVFVYAHVFRSK